jgi:hypothetical protein
VGAQRALTGILPKSPEQAVGSLAGHLTSSDKQLRAGAAIVMGGYQAAGKAAVPVLTELLASSEGKTRTRAIRALASIGYDARAAVAGLVRILTTDPEQDARRAAASALGVIDWSQPGVVPALTASMYDTNLETLESLHRIALDARARNSVGLLTQLQSAYDMMITGNITQSYGSETAKETLRTIDYLRVLIDREQARRSSNPILSHPVAFTLGVIVFLPLLVWFSLYAVAPLKLHELVRRIAPLRPFENMARIRDARMSILIRVTKGNDLEARRAAIAEMATIGPEGKLFDMLGKSLAIITGGEGKARSTRAGTS